MPDLAVLTGDIVRSSRLGASELGRAMAALARGAGEAAAWGDRPARFTRFRGDGWQCLAPAPALALRTALLLKARLRAEGRAFDTRIAVGIGAAELPPGDDLAAASGPAFTIAGHGLDAMPRSRRLAIGWERPPADAAKVEAILVLADEIARRWTPAQAVVLAQALAPEPPSQVDLASGLGAAQQTIAGHLRSAGAAAIVSALETVEAG